MTSTLTQVFTLVPAGTDVFRAEHHKENFNRSLFGGQVLAQALIAAGKTIEGLEPHSLHAYFLRAGSSLSPVDYHVSRNRDGRSFSHRSVEAHQDGRMIFSMMASFHREEPGFEHSDTWENPPPMPDNLSSELPPELAPTQPELKTEAFEFRPVHGGLFDPAPAENAEAAFWMRCCEPLANDPITQMAALAYASDFGLLATALGPHPATLFQPDVIGASVDHAMWFHQPKIAINDWHLYDTTSPWAGGARGLAHGRLFTARGELVASASQEGLIRPARPAP